MKDEEMLKEISKYQSVTDGENAGAAKMAWQ